MLLMNNQYQQLQYCACNMYRQSSRLITQAFEEAFREEGVKPSQFNVMSVLANTGPIPLTQLAQVLLLDRTGLTRNLKVMERNGWIQYEPCIDQRIKKVALSKKGFKKLDSTIPLWQQAQERVSKALGGLSELQKGLVALQDLGSD